MTGTLPPWNTEMDVEMISKTSNVKKCLWHTLREIHRIQNRIHIRIAIVKKNRENIGSKSKIINWMVLLGYWDYVFPLIFKFPIMLPHKSPKLVNRNLMPVKKAAL